MPTPPTTFLNDLRRQGREVRTAGRPPIVTIPASVLRMRLKPGEHVLSREWEGRKTEHKVKGAEGEVRFVELVGSVWSWGSSCGWEDTPIEKSVARARSSKLSADVDLFQ